MIDGWQWVEDDLWSGWVWRDQGLALMAGFTSGVAIEIDRGPSGDVTGQRLDVEQARDLQRRIGEAIQLVETGVAPWMKGGTG